MAEVSQEAKDIHFAIMKKHLPNVDDATINAIIEEISVAINERISKAIILPR